MRKQEKDLAAAVYFRLEELHRAIVAARAARLEVLLETAEIFIRDMPAGIGVKASVRRSTP